MCISRAAAAASIAALFLAAIASGASAQTQQYMASPVLAKKVCAEAKWSAVNQSQLGRWLSAQVSKDGGPASPFATINGVVVDNAAPIGAPKAVICPSDITIKNKVVVVHESDARKVAQKNPNIAVYAKITAAAVAAEAEVTLQSALLAEVDKRLKASGKFSSDQIASAVLSLPMSLGPKGAPVTYSAISGFTPMIGYEAEADSKFPQRMTRQKAAAVCRTSAWDGPPCVAVECYGSNGTCGFFFGRVPKMRPISPAGASKGITLDVSQRH